MSSPSDAANEGAAAASRSRSADTRGGGKKKFDFTGGMRFSQRIKKLVTREDPVHLHKTLGILSLLHFIGRYFVVYPSTGHLGFSDGSVADWAGVLLHQSLSTSSLIFTVIRHRIMDKPTIIWEEYRLHAIVFTLRGTSTFVFNRVWPPIEDPARPGHYGSDAQVFALFALLTLHMVVVDLITHWYGKSGETTVRGDGARTGPKFKVLMRFYSFYQFMALASHLTVHKLGADIGWNPMIAVQSAAFCMTLYRKRIINGTTYAVAYSVCLVLSALHIFRMLDGYEHFMLKVVFVFYLRVQLGVNKYVIWTFYAATLMPALQNAATAASLAAQTMAASALNGSSFEAAAAGNSTGGGAAAAFALPAYDSLAGRTAVLALGLYGILVMRKDERKAFKALEEVGIKEIDRITKERNRLEREARLAAAAKAKKAE